MTIPFTRQLGYESGVQLNPTIDNSERTASGLADQVIAVAMRCQRGQIGSPFKVDASNFFRKTGHGETMTKNALNEAHIQVYEALTSGAYEAVIMRLVPDTAVNNYIVARLSANLTAIDYTVEAAIPSNVFLFAIKHNECYNDGLVVHVHADELIDDTGAVVENREFTVKLIDPRNGALLYRFTGSSDDEALDDYGNSYYFPDVVASRTDAVEFIVPPVATARIPVASSAYGDDTNGFEKWAKTTTAVLYFTEGGTSYTTLNYIAARQALRGTQHDYGRIITAGSQSPALIAQMDKLAFEVDKPCDVDIYGGLTDEEAITFVDSLGIDSEYTNFFWSPNITDDPIGINKRGYIGQSGYHAARTCARNAQKNAYGFAPKQYPIAGKNHPISRTRIKQAQQLTGPQLSALAKAKINPICYEVYSGGGKTVFRDSLTSVKKSSSFLRLQSVVDRKCDVEERVTWIAKDALQLPMDEAIRVVSRGINFVFEGADASGWLQPAKDLGGAKYTFKVVPSEERPEDIMIVTMAACFTGTNRQTFITLSIERPN